MVVARVWPTGLAWATAASASSAGQIERDVAGISEREGERESRREPWRSPTCMQD